MRITVEKPVSAELGQVSLGRSLGQHLAVDAALLNLIDVVDLYPRHVLHRHHPFGGEVPVDIRHLNVATRN